MSLWPRIRAAWHVLLHGTEPTLKVPVVYTRERPCVANRSHASFERCETQRDPRCHAGMCMAHCREPAYCNGVCMEVWLAEKRRELA